MTAPFEIEEPEPIPLSGLVHVRCVQCRAPKVACAPDQAAVALCGGCRAQVAASATTILRLPAVSPPPMVWSGSEELRPQDRSERAELVSPELVCGSVCEHEAPGPVFELEVVAVGYGWSVETRHSRSVPLYATGKQGAKVEDFWSVRFRRDGWAGYAVRRGDAWDGVCVTGLALPPFLALGVTELRVWLADPERPASWYQEIRDRVAAQDLASKQRACPGPGECDWLPLEAVVDMMVRMLGAGTYAAGSHTHRANGDIKIKNSRKEAVSGA